MNLRLQHHVEVAVNRRGVIRRRDFLHSIPLAGAAAGALSWTDLLSARADELRNEGMACILLWMQGGPSQFETFSPKPNHANGGETKAIATAAAGIQISENLPQTASMMNDICLIRSMTGKEGSHPRASFLMRTGYLPTASVKYPSLGANVAQQIGDAASSLPSFVRIGRARSGDGGGFLGVDYDPFVVASAQRPPENTSPTTSSERYRRRLGLLDRLEDGSATSGADQESADQRKLYDKASRLVLSPKMDTFDIGREPQNVRQAYGESEFAAGCLLARRLVEAGVTFVEVSAGNWDTHDNNFERSRELCQQIDQPFANLLADLKQRGLLDKTLVLWMGEFGRTPRINPRGGRDHYPRAFNVALAGGGVRGGQVIGETDESGSAVTDRPVGVSDLLRTICSGLGVDPDHENMSRIGRPIKVVDGGEIVGEVFG